MKAARWFSAARRPPGHDYGCLDIAELAAPLIGDAKFESGGAVVRRDDGFVAEENLRPWPGEAGEEESRGEGDDQQSGDGF